MVPSPGAARKALDCDVQLHLGPQDRATSAYTGPAAGRAPQVPPHLPFPSLQKLKGLGCAVENEIINPTFTSASKKDSVSPTKEFHSVSVCLSQAWKLAFWDVCSFSAEKHHFMLALFWYFSPRKTAQHWGEHQKPLLPEVKGQCSLCSFSPSVFTVLFFFFIIIVPLQERGRRQGKVVFSPWIRFTAISVLPSTHVQYSAWGRCLCLHTPLDCRALTPNCRSQNNKD